MIVPIYKIAQDVDVTGSDVSGYFYTGNKGQARVFFSLDKSLGQPVDGIMVGKGDVFQIEVCGFAHNFSRAQHPVGSC